MKKQTTLIKALILSLALLVTVAFAFVGCGDDEETPGGGSSSTTQSSKPTESSKPAAGSSTTDSSTTDSSTTDSSTTDSSTTDSSTTDSSTTDSSTTDSSSEPSGPSDEPTTCAHTGGTASCNKLAVCELCGEEYGDLIEHSFVAPTCTEDGYCSVCNAAGEAALSHDYTVLVNETEPTCATDGSCEYKCVRCDSTEVRASGKTATGNHVLAYSETVEPTCQKVGYKLYTCKTCDLTRKNPNLDTPDEPLEEDIVGVVEHSYGDPSIDGLIACEYLCGVDYRDITSTPTEGNAPFCMGCGKEPCECGTENEWAGFGPAKDPEEISAEVAFVKENIQIGNGLILLSGESETAYTVNLYNAEGSLVGTLEETGDYLFLMLTEYADVSKVEITATTVAYVQLYAPVK